MSTRFKCVDWLGGASIYEVNIRQYTAEGTLNAFGEHLPRLRQMGVDILWFMPLTPISVQNRKGSLGSYYACSNYMEINPEFGTAEDFKALVYQAHQMGFKVIIDWVANHTGWDHVWTRHPDWYLRDAQDNFTETHGWEDVIDLNYQNADMQSAMIHAMKYWIGMFDIDGFRCDMAHLVPLSFWDKARAACEQLKPLLFLGECDEDSYSSVFDVTYAWRWMHDSEKLPDQDQLPAALKQLKATLQHYQSLPVGAEKLYFTSNHDENSWNGTAFEKYGALSPVLTAFIFLYPGVPLIYSGQEIPNNKRLKFFDKDQLDWPKPPEKPQWAAFYETLCNLHKLPAFALGGKPEWLDTSGMNDENGSTVLAYYLQGSSKANQDEQGQRALVIFNFSLKDSQLFALSGQLNAAQLQGFFTQLDQRMIPQKGTLLQPDERWVLPPASFIVLTSQGTETESETGTGTSLGTSTVHA